MPHGIQSLTIKQHTITKNAEILLLVHLALIRNADKVDGADATRTNTEGCTADGVDKRIKLLSIAEQPAAV